MVNVITGKIDSGKTTRMLEIYNQIRCGEGFVTKKIYKNNLNAGQKLVNLKTGKECAFSLKSSFLPVNWLEQYRYLDYSFSYDGIKFAERIIYNAVKNKNGPIFIDEVGPLEIYNEQGLFDAFVNALEYDGDLFVVVRESCLEEFVKKFNIKRVDILRM